MQFTFSGLQELVQSKWLQSQTPHAEMTCAAHKFHNHCWFTLRHCTFSEPHPAPPYSFPTPPPAPASIILPMRWKFLAAFPCKGRHLPNSDDPQPQPNIHSSYIKEERSTHSLLPHLSCLDLSLGQREAEILCIRQRSH